MHYISLEICTLSIKVENFQVCASFKWIEIIDRGGNGILCFLSMELEIRTYVPPFQPPNFNDITTAIKTSEDVKFYWCMLASDWGGEGGGRGGGEG